MRTLLTILVVGSLAAHVAEDASDLLQHVKFQSNNFENILTWDGGTDSTLGTVYSVEYKKYGDIAWLPKAGCQGITRKSCNLTMETGNHTEFYYARVTAISPGGRSATKMTDRFSSLPHTTIKPPDVTCIPKVRSIQMIIHPTPTPIRAGDGHQQTLEEMFPDLFYRVELHVNHTYKMHLEGQQREYEFSGLTPDTQFLGTTMILIPTWSKESAPYVCRVKTLPDRTWAYSFSGAVLFSMGFLVAMLCYLSYRYVTKLPVPPNSLNVQRVLTFQPLRFIQEHVLVPVFELGGPSGLSQPVQYSQVVVSGPREPPGATQLHGLPEISYLGQPDISVLQPRHASPRQTVSPPSCTPKATPEVGPPAYTPQVASEAKAPSYAPQATTKAQPLPYTPQASLDSLAASYGVCVDSSGKDSPSGTLSGPKHLRPKGQLQKEEPAGSCLPGDLSLQGVASMALEELCVDGAPGLNGEPGTPQYLGGQLSLLSSVQIEGHPGSLSLHTPALSCSPSDQEPSPWGLLESLVCPKDEGLVSKAEAKSPAPGASELEPPTEPGSLFKELALTVQWES
ncbi:interleukin-22 receptor subunit alpha-1 [Urocitellus parryii]